MPAFDAAGLITAVAVRAGSGEVLMVAHMNREALERTLANRQAWYWSRSRGELWLKGATSGQIQQVREIRVDCDQDCLLLVVDVGGTGLKENDLRGFLLRRMRVNPGEWFEVGVWDGKGEAAVAESIRKAPAGVVLLAEGWALSPPRMTALCRQIRSLAKAGTPIYFLVVNVGSDGKLTVVKQEEKAVWKDFADGLADAALEVFFHEGEGAS
jgi:phosphoribosyl-AMP cyclohydrolase